MNLLSPTMKLSSLMIALALVTLSTPAIAQNHDDGTGQNAKDNPNAQRQRDRAQQNRPDAPKIDANAPPAGTKPQDAEKIKGDTKDAGKSEADDEAAGHMNAKAAQKKILLEEAKFRKQKARIQRLRELAQEQGNQERLAALDKLEAKMTELHDRKVAAAKASLSDEDSKKIAKELEKGRGRNKARDHGKGANSDNDKGKSKANDDRGKPDHTGNNKKPGNDSAKPNTDNGNRGKPDNAGSGKDKPKGKPGSA